MCLIIPVHQHRHTHRLPGLCHSTAVTATAPWAPGQPNLLLSLPAIKVVCEFSKTRHLPLRCSPPPPSVLQPCFPSSRWKIINKCFWLCSAKLLGTQTPELSVCLLPGFSFSQRSECPRVPSSRSYAALNRQKNELKPALPFLCFFFWPVSAARRTRARAHTNTQTLSK